MAKNAKNQGKGKISQESSSAIGGHALPDEIIAKGHMAVFNFLDVADFGHGHPTKKAPKTH